MDFLKLKYFQKVAETEHITKSARELNIEQPALSITISNLEKELGIELFDRVGRNIKLNEYGKSFLRRVNNIFYELEVGKEDLIDLQKRYNGSVYFVSSSIDKYFSHLIKQFSIEYPQINLFIKQESLDSKKIDLLLDNKVDFAFINSITDNDKIVSELLIEERIVLAISNNHRLANRSTITLNEIAEESFIKLNYEDNIQKIYKEIEELFHPNVIYECNDELSLLNLVDSGLGVAFIPHSKIEKNSLPVTLIEVSEIKTQSPLQLSFKKDINMSSPKRAFYNYIINHVN